MHPDGFWQKSTAQPGDELFLTKPLGTGIVTTAIKNNLANPALESAVIRVMTKLNTVGTELAKAGLVKAGVDVTGFGLLSHLGAMCRSSKVSAEISAGSVPVISPDVFDLIAAKLIPGGSRDNLEYASAFTEWDGVTDAQKRFRAWR